jgi:bacterioferritin-associated ferredoxin
MPTNPLFYPISDSAQAQNLHDQIQIALAIADRRVLESLLENCIPTLAKGQHLHTISTQVGVPTGNHHTADGIVHFESKRCRLAKPGERMEASVMNSRTLESRELARLTQHESDLQTLGNNLPLALTVSLLAESGFRPEQVEDILHLPYDAWHKSWWYAIDPGGNFTLPFLRQMRTLRYPDGTFTLQYKDFFEQDNPNCFISRVGKVLVLIKPDTQGFGETLRQINYQRDALGIEQAILICSTISDLEAQGFINQGISVYPAVELILPTQTNCMHCGRKECGMNGVVDSPVALCYGFLPESEFV